MGRRIVVAMLVGTIWMVGCAEADDEEPTPDESVEEAGVELTVDFMGDTDVAGFEFKITECKSDKHGETPGVVAHEVKDLEDLVLPGMIPEFENDPFDEGSRHLFADYYTSLPAGCYDIDVTPVSRSGQPSEDCAAVTETGVEVREGKTTEILLVSQCEGRQLGGLDVVAALNHPPEIRDVEFEKFNHECDTVKVCATAFDPDDDPLEFVWQQTDGPKLVDELSPVSPETTVCEETPCESGEDGYVERQSGDVTRCVEMRLGEAGDYEFELRVHDLYWDDDRLVRFPDSSASLTFPIYAAEKPEIECPPKDDGDKWYE